MNWFRTHFATILFFTILIFALGYSIVTSIRSSDKSEKAKTAQIATCERSLAKSQLVIKFMESAADTRRAAAAADLLPAQRLNDLHAAIEYETLAKKFDQLTPKDCIGNFDNP